MTELHRVVVTGIGVVSPVGNWPGEFFNNVAAGHSGIRLLPALDGQSSPVQIAAWIDSPMSDVGKGAPHDRVTKLALAAGGYALAEAGLLNNPELLVGTGVHLGSGSSCSATVDQAFYHLYRENRNRLAPMTLPRSINNAPASELAIRFGLTGVNNTYSIACASSATAIGEALRAIRHGYTERILAGGSEALLTYGILHAWHALRALAPPDLQVEASCRPFSADRNGLVLGEGAAFMVLERLTSAQARGAPILAEMIGYGTSCDATHITHPASIEQVRAIQNALADAEIDASAIDYVNAHGTGTVVGDSVEAESLRTVFHDTPPVSSSKAVHGHMMGAGGAIELATSILAMQESIIPPTAHCRVNDPSLGIDVVTGCMRRKTIRTALSNSFAFGGSNAVLIARK